MYLKGYQAEKDPSTGKEKWPIGDEATWQSGLRGVDPGVYTPFTHRLPSLTLVASINRPILGCQVDCQPCSDVARAPGL
jgi:hypothetical protein